VILLCLLAASLAVLVDSDSRGIASDVLLLLPVVGINIESSLLSNGPGSIPQQASSNVL